MLNSDGLEEANKESPTDTGIMPTTGKSKKSRLSRSRVFERSSDEGDKAPPTPGVSNNKSRASRSRVFADSSDEEVKTPSPSKSKSKGKPRASRSSILKIKPEESGAPDN